MHNQDNQEEYAPKKELRQSNSKSFLCLKHMKNRILKFMIWAWYCSKKIALLFKLAVWTWNKQYKNGINSIKTFKISLIEITRTQRCRISLIKPPHNRNIIFIVRITLKTRFKANILFLLWGKEANWIFLPIILGWKNEKYPNKIWKQVWTFRNVHSKCCYSLFNPSKPKNGAVINSHLWRCKHRFIIGKRLFFISSSN